MKNSETIDNFDPLFLVSRQLDGDLTEAEALVLDAALAASPELRAEAAQMAAAHGLVDQWAREIPSVDEAALAHRVLAIVRAEATDRQFADVDALLHRWSQPVTFNERAFTQNVAKKLRAEKSRSRLRLAYRTAVPLAMAAAVAIAVTGSFWLSATPMIQVSIGPLAASRHAITVPDDAVTSVVTFARVALEERVVQLDAPMISLGAMGAEELVGADEVPPL